MRDVGILNDETPEPSRRGRLDEAEAELERLRASVKDWTRKSIEQDHELERLREEILEYESRERFDRTEIARLHRIEEAAREAEKILRTNTPMAGAHEAWDALRAALEEKP